VEVVSDKEGYQKFISITDMLDEGQIEKYFIPIL